MEGSIADLKVGDVISLGTYSSVPKEYGQKFWKIKALREGDIELEGPFNDQACTERFHLEPI